MSIDKEFWEGKRVLITGHTGFKGSWLSMMLHKLGSEIYGYALDPPTHPNLFEEAGISELVSSHIGDIRNYGELLSFVEHVKPEIVIHMAAQPLVRESYRNPVETYAVNVMGTVNLLEAVRDVCGVKAVINVTTDKCYENKEWHWGYRENEPLGGYDPYSSSKGCSEIITAAYRSSFFNAGEYKNHGVAVATARAGNVIGGGDWAEDRLIPDFVRAVTKGEEVRIRSPYAIRPWQHVLDPLAGYLMLAEQLYSQGPDYAEPWNFGPGESDARNVGWIAERFKELWGEGFSYAIDTNPQPHEATYLKLDCSKARTILGWEPQWGLEKALKLTVQWYSTWFSKEDVRTISAQQIEEYLSASLSV